MKTILATLVLAILAGCSSHQYAIDTLNRMEVLDDDISRGYSTQARKVLGALHKQSTDLHVAKAKLAILEASGGLPVDPKTVIAVLDQLAKDELESGAVRAEVDSNLDFLDAQAHLRYALSNVLRIYIEGQRGISTLVQKRVADPTITAGDPPALPLPVKPGGEP